MPTLQELTLEHSRRLSAIYRDRDVRATEAQTTRDLQLRALPRLAKAFERYDEELASAREKQLAADAKAEAARAAALTSASDRRSERLEDAQAVRRAADAAAMQLRRRLEDAAETRFQAALTDAREGPESTRARSLQDAERTRRADFDAAKRAHDGALAAAHQQYRASVDEALIAERRQAREDERAYFDALRLSEAASKAARTAADQTLLIALNGVPEAREILRAWRDQLATISAEAAQAEREEFSRFRRELQTVTV